MAKGFLVFDVETPNKQNDRICQIGLVGHTGGMDFIDQRVYLVNPEAPFDDICCGIHGIRACDVLDKPTFAHLWESGLAELFNNSIVVAHNASFDLGVLRKTLNFYGLELSDILYVDTLELSRKHYPMLSNHKLCTVASFLGHPIPQAHDALNDSYAAYMILIETFRRHGQSALSPKYYYSGLYPKQNSKCGIHDLQQILECILADGKISFEEAWALNEWIENNKGSLPKALYEDFSQKLFNVLLDGTIDANEETLMLKTFSAFLHPTECVEGVEFQGKEFVLSGEFLHGTKLEISKHLEEKGGVVKSGVSKTTDYVVIGDFGSDRYGHGTYGTKAMKAMEFQKQGSKIKIIREGELFPGGK
jgi:DNA polymerase-3 subunit epsilon